MLVLVILHHRLRRTLHLLRPHHHRILHHLIRRRQRIRLLRVVRFRLGRIGQGFRVS